MFCTNANEMCFRVYEYGYKPGSTIDPKDYHTLENKIPIDTGKEFVINDDVRKRFTCNTLEELLPTVMFYDVYGFTSQMYATRWDFQWFKEGFDGHVYNHFYLKRVL